MFPLFNSTRAFLKAQWRPLGLCALIFVIITAAHHPLHPPLMYWAYRAVLPIGIEVAMTPLTVDMMYGSDAAAIPPYARKMSLHLGMADGRVEVISLRQLKLTFFQVPFLLGAELDAQTYLKKGGVHNIAICRALRYQGYPAVTFMVRSEPPVGTDLDNGLNVVYECAENP